MENRESIAATAIIKLADRNELNNTLLEYSFTSLNTVAGTIKRPIFHANPKIWKV